MSSGFLQGFHYRPIRVIPVLSASLHTAFLTNSELIRSHDEEGNTAVTQSWFFCRSALRSSLTWNCTRSRCRSWFHACRNKVSSRSDKRLAFFLLHILSRHLYLHVGICRTCARDVQRFRSGWCGWWVELKRCRYRMDAGISRWGLGKCSFLVHSSYSG